MGSLELVVASFWRLTPGKFMPIPESEIVMQKQHSRFD